jgi:predicted RNA binding protein YcfA (HicA-like mRNA interferase family)
VSVSTFGPAEFELLTLIPSTQPPPTDGRGVVNEPDQGCIVGQFPPASIFAMWFKVAQKGSHAQFKHRTRPGRVTVSHPKKNIAIGTPRSIEKQSGVKLR